jgi:hypothetical protein
MKKTFKFAAMTALATLALTGCVTTTVLLTDAANKEEAEIKSGKVFEIQIGTVTYDGLLTLEFKDYGKYIQVTNYAKGTALIIRPDSAFSLDTYNKTYTASPNTQGRFYYSDQSMVFPEAWFDLQTWVGDLLSNDNEKEKKNVAGKECAAFITDRYEYAGYKRIYMYKKFGSNVSFKANDFRSTYESNFEVPQGYKRLGEGVAYSSDFR